MRSVDNFGFLLACIFAANYYMHLCTRKSGLAAGRLGGGVQRMSTGDERVYFDDEYFLVTSKRIVDRANGKTIPVKEISSAEVEFAPLRDRDPTDRLFEWIFSVFGMRIGRERFGEIRIVVLVSGKRVTMLEARISWNTKDDYPRLVGELGSFSMASKWKEVVAYCQNLAISVGAASVGA